MTIKVRREGIMFFAVIRRETARRTEHPDTGGRFVRATAFHGMMARSLGVWSQTERPPWGILSPQQARAVQAGLLLHESPTRHRGASPCRLRAQPPTPRPHGAVDGTLPASAPCTSRRRPASGGMRFALARPAEKPSSEGEGVGPPRTRCGKHRRPRRAISSSWREGRHGHGRAPYRHQR
jgi:hypothetical protein